MCNDGLSHEAIRADGKLAIATLISHYFKTTADSPISPVVWRKSDLAIHFVECEDFLIRLVFYGRKEETIATVLSYIYRYICLSLDIVVMKDERCSLKKWYLFPSGGV